MSKKAKRKKSCLTRGCGGEPHSRGVCTSCYSSHRYAVRVGKTTWNALEQAGAVLLPDRTPAYFQRQEREAKAGES